MKDRFFLDTNILVYSFERPPSLKAQIARGLVRTALSTGKGAISFQVVQEFLNLALRRTVVLVDPSELLPYLDGVLLPLLAVHSSKQLYVDSLRLQSRYRFSWYDSLIVAAALQAECKVLFTEDLQHGQKFDDLRTENPFL